jgi:arylsulfatase A-like enzyme
MVKHGFDDYCMWTGAEGSEDKGHMRQSSERYWDPYIHTKEGSKTYPGKFGPDIYNDFVLDFISKHKEKPFFIYYPMALAHTPFVHTPLAPNAQTKLEKQIAMVEYTDFLLGKIIAKLEEEKIRNKTIVIWTCDNGSTGGISNMRNGRKVSGGKMKTTEKGVNTPFIVSCPGLVPAGIVSDALVDFSDMYPTFTDIAGGAAESGFTYDGVSLKEVFLGKAEKSQRPWILGMGSHPARMTDKGVESVYFFRDRVIRNERFKLFIDANRKPTKVVDVLNDFDEKVNLIGNPQFKAECEKLIAIIPTLPIQDNDPIYTHLPANDWELKPKVKSQVHKTGHPDYVAPKKKKKKAKKE